MGSTIISGLMLGSISLATLIISFLKLPEIIKRLLLSIKWITDLAAGALVYVVLGQTLVAIIASAWTTLWVGVILHFVKGTNND